MKNLINKIFLILCLHAAIVACKEDEAELGPPPSAAEAEFTATPSAENENIIQFSNPSGAFLKRWEFGNGQTAEGDSPTMSYTFAGSYEVKLTVYTAGGSVSSTQTVVIEETDLSQLDPAYAILTGYPDDPDGKTWVVDKATAGHMGIGPIDADAPIWWAAPPNDKSDVGLYDDKYTFILDGLAFVQETNGDVYVNGAQQANFPGAYLNKGDYTAPFDAPENLTYTVTREGDQLFLTINNGGFMSYYTGVSKYEILSITPELITFKYGDAAAPGNAWFGRLVPDGFEPPPPPPPATTALPVDFEGAAPPFNGFGGSTFAVVDNPDASGINTSAKVAQYVKGLDGNWAGIETTLSAPLDFSTNTLFKYKVYSPVAGRALFKVEEAGNSGNFVEVFADVTQVNEWQELTFDFSGATSGVFNKIALFLDFDNNAGGTFYLDDIQQTAPPPDPSGFTVEDLTGGSSRAWVLKPAAGSFGVSDIEGADTWWPNGADISGDRPCLFNDRFIFNSNGDYEYDSQGDIFGEGYLGITPDGCADESSLSADAQAWGSGVHSFTFTPASDSAPAEITVTGTGAFIALPKAKNGAEYAAGPPDTDGSVTYKVFNYDEATQTLTLTVNIGGGFWTFVLIPEE
jgi:PKD repeat protein